MAHPTQVRLSDETLEKLKKFYSRTGFKHSHVIRLAMDRVFSQLTDEQLRQALFEAKAKEAQE